MFHFLNVLFLDLAKSNYYINWRQVCYYFTFIWLFGEILFRRYLYFITFEILIQLYNLYKKILYRILKGFVITNLYSAFFIVQLFFNFDFSLSKKSFHNFEFQKLCSSQNAHQSFQSQKSITAKNNIRLNKRFQPSGFPECHYPDFDLITKFYTPISIGYNYKETLNNTVLLSSSLRGPPTTV